MTDEASSPARPPGYRTVRMEAFSDGVLPRPVPAVLAVLGYFLIAVYIIVPFAAIRRPAPSA